MDFNKKYNKELRYEYLIRTIGEIIGDPVRDVTYNKDKKAIIIKLQ